MHAYMIAGHGQQQVYIHDRHDIVCLKVIIAAMHDDHSDQQVTILGDGLTAPIVIDGKLPSGPSHMQARL